MSQLIAPDDVDLEQIDLLDPKWHTSGPPHALLARVREEAPAHRYTYPDGRTYVSLTRHADVSAASRDTDTFSSYEAGIYLEPDQLAPLDLLRNLLLFKDPPEHTKYRKILQTAFTPHTVAKLEEGIRARVARTLDAVLEAGECDFIEDVAVPIPLGVLAELMGFGDDLIPQMYEWTERIEQAQRSPEPAGATEVFVELAGFINEQIARQAAEDNDTLVTRLRDAEVDGEKLNDAEILVFFALLIFAGNDTTRNTAGHGMKLLCEHPEAFRGIVEDPSRIPSTVEEMLRHSTVVSYFCRTATKDVELSGTTIVAGEKVALWYAAASRDPEVFPDPDRFDPTREKPDHKAFGGGGRHFCLGAGLARLELRILFEELVARVDRAELAGEPEWLGSPWANALTRLPIRFERREG